MKPTDFMNNHLVIDTSMDELIFPEGISHGLNVINPQIHNDYYHYDHNHNDFPEIDIEEFRSHI